MYAFAPAILALRFKLIADLTKSIEVDPTFLNDALHNLVLVTQEVLESAVLLKIAARMFSLLVLVEMQHVVRNLVEWDVVHVQRLSHVISSDVIVIVGIVLVELIVPE